MLTQSLPVPGTTVKKKKLFLEKKRKYMLFSIRTHAAGGEERDYTRWRRLIFKTRLEYDGQKRKNAVRQKKKLIISEQKRRAAANARYASAVVAQARLRGTPPVDRPWRRLCCCLSTTGARVRRRPKEENQPAGARDHVAACAPDTQTD